MTHSQSCKLSLDTLRTPTKGNILFFSIIKYIPSALVRYYMDKAPVAKLDHIRYTGRVVTDVARALVKEKSAALLQGRGSKDIMSLIGEPPIVFIAFFGILNSTKSRRTHPRTLKRNLTKRKCLLKCSMCRSTPFGWYLVISRFLNQNDHPGWPRNDFDYSKLDTPGTVQAAQNPEQTSPRNTCDGTTYPRTR